MLGKISHMYCRYNNTAFFFLFKFRLDADVPIFPCKTPQCHFLFFASVSWGCWFPGPNLSSGGALDTALLSKGALSQ